MIESLNDDCQLLIINYLELKDQLALCEATEDIATRLNGNVCYVWQRQLSYVLRKEILEELHKHPKQLKAFLSSIGPTVQQLNLRFITVKQLERWSGHSFPNMRTLEYTVDDRENPERALKRLVAIFPSVQSVTPFGEIKGQTLANWKELRQLDLTESGLRDQTTFVANFQFLEELAIDRDNLHTNFIKTVLWWPKLLRFCLHIRKNGESVLEQIIEQRGQDIRHLIFNDIIWDFQPETIKRIRGLRQLTILEDDGFQAAQLQSLVKDLQQLKQLNLVDFQLWRSEAELWQIVASCPSLSILYISGMQFYGVFFEISRRYMNAALDKRSAPLFLHLHNTGNQKMIEDRFKHTNLVVSFEPLKVDYINESHMKIHFVLDDAYY